MIPFQKTERGKTTDRMFVYITTLLSQYVTCTHEPFCDLSSLNRSCVLFDVSGSFEMCGDPVVQLGKSFHTHARVHLANMKRIFLVTLMFVKLDKFKCPADRPSSPFLPPWRPPCPWGRSTGVGSWTNGTPSIRLFKVWNSDTAANGSASL